MAPRKRQPAVQPLSRTPEGIGDLAKSGKAVILSPIAPKEQEKLLREVMQHIDRGAIAVAVMELCRTYAIKPAGDHLMLMVFRAVRATVQVHYRRPLDADQITASTIAFLPFVLSELLLGLAAVHAEWLLVAHAPALTLLPILLESRGRAHPTLLRAARRERPVLPSEDEVRGSKAFAYALGWTISWLQTQDVPESATNSNVFEVGNEALNVFEKAYEDALYGRTSSDHLNAYGRDGNYLIAQFEKAVLADVGREAGEPEFDASSLQWRLHPIIAAAMHCDETLANEALRRDLRMVLEGALRKLSQKQQVAWHLHHLQQMSDDDMATAMGIDKHTARTHLYRANESIARGDYFTTLQELANNCEDKALFMDLVSLALGPEAYAALNIELPSNPERTVLASVNHRTQGGDKK
ncbi:MAG: hypothetical protein HY836_09825 [Aquabacterium sp.]|uniref:hypothetical protein n=1 Tax=Aquabacterium sp. TaxID=1872578 RepID=UPI0025BC0555|nr:hypothetical protein [Aquabacterium sp.]MBI5925883.1 hypothetical protein [Aquabacterium sp.]